MKDTRSTFSWCDKRIISLKWGYM